jgi:hypothetical protein
MFRKKGAALEGRQYLVAILAKQFAHHRAQEPQNGECDSSRDHHLILPRWMMMFRKCSYHVKNKCSGYVLQLPHLTEALDISGFMG